MANNEEQMIFFQLLGLTPEANRAINKAIHYSGDENCEDVNTVHLFLGLLTSTRTGESILKSLSMTFDEVYAKYKELVNNRVYGYMDSSNINFTPDYFSDELIMIANRATQGVIFFRKEINEDGLMDILLETKSETLEKFLTYIGTSFEEIENLQFKEFNIPEELTDYIEDLHKSPEVLNNTYKNVDNYVDDMVEVLSRKRKANPCLVGLAGVGKTSIVYAYVQRLMAENSETHVCYIDGSTLTANTKYRGEFEERMKLIIDWAKKSNVILFLDEIHTFINVNSNGGSADTAGNMIKKSLADGSIKIIGATTQSEYHKYIECDEAFRRRLQPIDIKEPTPEQAFEMIKGTIKDYANFHGIAIPTKCIEMAISLSVRYMRSEHLPDKAYTVLDQAAAYGKLAGHKVVLETDILRTISKNTGIDINKLDKDEVKRILNLEESIKKRLIGQETAVSTVAKAVKRGKSGISHPDKPIASFLFVGPTGVGKTELCKVLSKETALGKESFIKIDMSEFNEQYSISKLIGSAPGYIGYKEGGQLTEKVKHNPNSVILFDEIEKAHPDIYNLFLQLLDEGKLTDSEGSTVDFTNCIIVMTSNAGYGINEEKELGFSPIKNTDKKDHTKENEKKAREALKKTFRPEFLNRIDNIVIFESLTDEQCKEVTELLLDDVASRLKGRDIKLHFDDSVIDKITKDGYSKEYGARNLRREIQDTVENELADYLLDGTIKDRDTVYVSYKDNELCIETQ